ncbi:MAG: molybdenum cofactor guanylyltransferase [Terriglobales bacterium]
MENSRMGFVLAGGQGSRMGTDKAFLNFGGCTLLERAIAVLGRVCDVAIVGDPAKFSHYGTVIEDAYPGRGPLAGIHAALVHSSAELNLVLAVDMPLVSPDLLAFLFASAGSTGALVTVPHSARGFQPLCAVYRRPFAIVAEQALKAGKNKIDALFATIPIRVIEGEELASAGFSDQVFLNLNTPEDIPTKWPGPDQTK